MTRITTPTALILITSALLGAGLPAPSSAAQSPGKSASRIQSPFPECDDVYLVKQADAGNLQTPAGCSAVAGVPDVGVLSSKIPDETAAYSYFTAVAQEVSRELGANARIDATENLPCFTRDASRYRTDPPLDPAKYDSASCRQMRTDLPAALAAVAHVAREQLAIASAAARHHSLLDSGMPGDYSVFTLNKSLLSESEKSKIFKEPLTAAEKATADRLLRARLEGKKPGAAADLRIEEEALARIKGTMVSFHLLMTLPTPSWDDKSHPGDPTWTDDQFASSIKQALDFTLAQKGAAEKSIKNAVYKQPGRLEESDAHRLGQDLVPFLIGDECLRKDASARPISCYAAFGPAQRAVLKNDKANHARFCATAALWNSWRSHRDNNFMVGELALTTAATLPLSGVAGAAARSMELAAASAEQAAGGATLASKALEAGAWGTRVGPGGAIGGALTGNQIDEARQQQEMARLQVTSDTGLSKNQKSIRDDEDINKAHAALVNSEAMSVLMPAGFGALGAVAPAVKNAILTRLARAAVVKTGHSETQIVTDLQNLITKNGWSTERINSFMGGLDNTGLSPEAKARLRARLGKASAEVAKLDLQEIEHVRFPEYMKLLKDKREMRELAQAIRSAHTRWTESYVQKNGDQKKASDEAWDLIAKKLKAARAACVPGPEGAAAG